ncbi:DUF7079 family protein [Aquimarina algicola]|uniref:DUF7079 domain-containing protein n=1 Tax=Aquimarina algicola TaxID=2589995 RepID=A0A504IVD7_9FLAO|nr:hypothetical protein [Aquimarina algicola]TPN82316.1 hypothetical protein FHK87_23110 [Aquimarina algicola]
MKEEINIKERKPIWIVLSEFYLDTELQEHDFRYIAKIIINSPYSLEKVKEINVFEVFPVLQSNLLSVAGEWAGFNEEWLITEILSSLQNRNKLQELNIKAQFKIHKWMQKDYWEKIEQIYDQIKSGYH